LRQGRVKEVKQELMTEFPKRRWKTGRRGDIFN
jgi:hypothetical protein